MLEQFDTKALPLLERLMGAADDMVPGGWRVAAIFALFALWFFVRSMRRMLYAIRMRKPARLNAKLRHYGGTPNTDDEFVAKQRREQAERIVATSSTSTIAGYEIVEQVEAVFVDGFRRAEEALEGLKAVAAMKKANALTNLAHDRTTSGRCSVRGDAVVVRKKSAPPTADSSGSSGLADCSENAGTAKEDDAEPETRTS